MVMDRGGRSAESGVMWASGSDTKWASAANLREFILLVDVREVWKKIERCGTSLIVLESARNYMILKRNGRSMQPITSRQHHDR
jgi:hypothetical protein